MLQFTVSVEIKAEPERVWRYLLDIGNWWLPSNPEHESIEILDGDEPLRPGTRIRIRERIAGIPGEAIGSVTEYQASASPGRPMRRVTASGAYRSK